MLSFLSSRKLAQALALSTFFILYLLGQQAGAEPPRGRLSDGRAYRLNEQGVQLVDHLAELEVTVDDLKRQITALENELEQKNELVNRLSAGKGRHGSSKIKETDLAVPGASTGTLRAKTPPNCNELVSSLYLKVSSLESALEAERQTLGSIPKAKSYTCPACPSPSKATTCDYQSSENPLWDQVAKLQDELMKNPSPEELVREKQKREQLEVEIVQLRRRLGAVEEENRQALLAKEGSADELSSMNTRLLEFSEQLALMERKLEEKDLELASAKQSMREREASASEAIRLARRSSEVEQATREEEVRHLRREIVEVEEESVDEKNRIPALALASAKKDFSSSLEVIQKKILRRKDIHDALEKRGAAVRIRLQPLETRNGTSLDAIRRQIKDLQTESDIRQARAAIKEIEERLDEDIAVLSRLRK